MIVDSHAEEETQALGFFLGQSILEPIILLLEGDLGVGKSVLARGLARGLGVSEDVPITSPTFTLLNHYSARLDLYHFDLYRLTDAEELLEIGFDDFAHNCGVALVEWPERLDSCDFDHLTISFKRLDECRRRLTFAAQGVGPSALLKQIKTWSLC